MRTLRVLQRQKGLAARSMPKTAEIIKGTLVEVERVCGKPNCKCKKGEKHKCLCISQYVNGKSRMVYIPKMMEKRIREYVGNYKRIKQCINELTEINLEIMKQQL